MPEEVLTAIGDVIGRERTGIRLSPFITQRGMNDPQVIDAILAPGGPVRTAGYRLYPLAEADWDDAPAVPQHFRDTLRATFSGTLIVAGNYDQQKAERILTAGFADWWLSAGRLLLILTCRSGFSTAGRWRPSAIPPRCLAGQRWAIPTIPSIRSIKSENDPQNVTCQP